MFRGRGREMEREREMGKGGKEEKREREREREREGGEGRVIYTICALFATMLSEKGGGEFKGDKSRYGNSKNTYKNKRIGKRT